MAMVVRAVTKLHSLDSVVDDPSISFTFQTTGAAVAGDTSAVTNACIAFFNTLPTGGSAPLGGFVSKVMSRATGASAVEIYDITNHLDGSPHGSPIAVTAWALGNATPGASGLPEGVAATISFRADYGTDVEFQPPAPDKRPRARDRNRVYLGPLQTNCITNDATTNRCYFNSTFIGTALGALHDISLPKTTGSITWNLRVWSRVNAAGSPTNLAALKVPTFAYMDDRPDYQRRRSDPNPAGRLYLPLSGT